MFLDIESLLRPVYGHQKQGASFGHAKIAGRALLRKGLSPLITTLSTPTAAPVIAEAWLRSGKTGSGRGAARQLKQAITTARAIDADATIMARGDSAFGTKKMIAACLDEQIEFSLTLSRNRRVTKAIQAIDDDAVIPVHYPGAVVAHNLLRAAGVIAGGDHAVARGATLRRDLINVPARFAAPARKPMLHLPAHWPRQIQWKTKWLNVIGYPTAQPRAA